MATNEKPKLHVRNQLSKARKKQILKNKADFAHTENHNLTRSTKYTSLGDIEVMAAC